MDEQIKRTMISRMGSCWFYCFALNMQWCKYVVCV